MLLADLDEVQAIEEISFNQSWLRQSFRTELERNRLACYLVARRDRDGRVLGFGGIWIILDEAHLTTLAVAQADRGKGIGAALLQALQEKAAAAGAQRMTLEVRPSNLVARRLYGKFGFSVRGIRKKYYLTEDALLMVKEGLDNDLPPPPIGKTGTGEERG